MAEGALVERVTFAGGEIGRALKARTDLARYQISVEAMENYIVMVEGGATRRPGTRFVGIIRFSPEKGLLIPFRFTATDSYMIVLNAGALEFIRNGAFVESSPGTRLVVGTSFVQADLPNIRTVARGNIIFFASGRLPLESLQRNGLTSWQRFPFLTKGGPFDLQNLNAAQTILVSPTTASNVWEVGAPVQLSANFAVFTAGQVNSVWRFDESTLANIPEWAADEGPTSPATNMTGERRRYNGNVYEAQDGINTGINPPVHTVGVVRSGGISEGAPAWLFLHGDHGVVRINSVSGPTLAFGTVETPMPISCSTQATFRWWKGSWNDVDGYPTNLAWSNQRLWVFRGDRFWASSILSPDDFEETEADDSAFSGKLLSPEAHGSLVEIVWAASSGNLVIGSSDVEWRVSGSAQGGPITAKTVTPTPDAKEGSLPHIPAVVDDSIMFIGRSGKRLNRAKIDIADTGSNKLGTDEVSVGVRDLFDAGPRRMAWQRDPHRVLWMTMADGTLVGMTWMEKQKVLAMHHHPMLNAVVEDVAAIPGAGEDQVYMIVQRIIEGGTLRYIEQLQPFFKPKDLNVPTAEGAWFVDCGLEGTDTVAKTVWGGLDHLDGQQVAVLADGAMQSKRTVDGTAHTITLDRPAKHVIVGLPIISYLLDLPRDVATQAGPSIGQKKGVRDINLYIDMTAGGRVGAKPKDDADSIPTEPINETGDKDYHTPLELLSGLRRMEVECDIQDELQLFVINDDPLPCSILGLSPRVVVEES
jgi:hypothetical protein